MTRVKSLGEETLYGIGGSLASGYVDMSILGSKVFPGHHTLKHLVRSITYQVGGNLFSGNALQTNFGLDASLTLPALGDVASAASPLFKGLARRYIDKQKVELAEEYGASKGINKLRTTVHRLKLDPYTDRNGIFSLYIDASVELDGNFRVNPRIPLVGGHTGRFNPRFSISGQSLPLYYNAHIFNRVYLSQFR